jgi:hypothetical protein
MDHRSSIVAMIAGGPDPIQPILADVVPRAQTISARRADHAQENRFREGVGPSCIIANT